MSSLKDKLYNYEQAPPGKAWDKIAAALDESHITDKFPSKLYNTEIAPPANVWDNITATLDESYTTDKFPSKLYNAEVAPPAGTWDKIVSSLEPEQATTGAVTRNLSFFRYAAAAVLIGLVAFGVIKWANSNNSHSNGGVAATTDTTNKNTNPKSDLSEKKNTIEPAKEPQDRITDEPVNEIAATDPIKTHSIKKAKTTYTTTDDPDAVEAIYTYNEHTSNLADRYIMLMTPDGGIIRMSKKWGNMVCCVSGQEQDKDCQDQIKKWQEKLACAPVANGSFMDILSLVNTLNTDL